MLCRSKLWLDRLIIVESPTKCLKIKDVLQSKLKEWTQNLINEKVLVLPTYGHFMENKDLVIQKSPYSIKNSFCFFDDSVLSVTPISNVRLGNSSIDSIVQVINTYSNIDKSTLLNEKLRANNLNEIILATDPDREGELIAVHLYRYLSEHFNFNNYLQFYSKNSSDKKKVVSMNFSRAYIQAITESGILSAFKNRKKEQLHSFSNGEDYFKNIFCCNYALADAASIRHLADRLFGYIGSTTLRQLNSHFKSIGRVQAPALQLINERENLINKAILKDKTNQTFIVQGLIKIQQNDVEVLKKNISFQISELDAYHSGNKKNLNNNNNDTNVFPNREAAEIWISDFLGNEKQRDYQSLMTVVLKEATFVDVKKKPPKPFNMAMLISQFNAKNSSATSGNITDALQELFQAGLITYPRTDSTRIDKNFVENEIKAYIENKYRKYVLQNQSCVTKKKENLSNGQQSLKLFKNWHEEEIGDKKKKKKNYMNIEDAHEALRPTSLKYEPGNKEVDLVFEKNIKNKYARAIYEMIFQNTISAFMCENVVDTVSVTFGFVPNHLYNSSFNLESKKIIFTTLSAGREKNPGWKLALRSGKCSTEGNIDIEFDGPQTPVEISNDLYDTITLASNLLPSLKKNKDQKKNTGSVRIEVVNLFAAVKQVTLPKLHTEGTLIQALKQQGIGRPSTYAAIIDTLKQRQYITVGKVSNTHTELKELDNSNSKKKKKDKTSHNINNGSLQLTFTGKTVLKLSTEIFPDFVHIGFTSAFESELEKIRDFRVSFSDIDSHKNLVDSGISPFEAPVSKKKQNKNNDSSVGLSAEKQNVDFGEGNNPLGSVVVTNLLNTMHRLITIAILKHKLLQYAAFKHKTNKNADFILEKNLPQTTDLSKESHWRRSVRKQIEALFPPISAIVKHVKPTSGIVPSYIDNIKRDTKDIPSASFLTLSSYCALVARAVRGRDSSFLRTLLWTQDMIERMALVSPDDKEWFRESLDCILSDSAVVCNEKPVSVSIEKLVKEESELTNQGRQKKKRKSENNSISEVNIEDKDRRKKETISLIQKTKQINSQFGDAQPTLAQDNIENVTKVFNPWDIMSARKVKNG